MKVDPAVVRIFAENVRADIIVRPAGLNLDPAIVKKIANKVKVFQGMTTDCLMSTLAMAEHIPHKAGEVVFNEGDIGSSFHVLITGEVLVENKPGRPGGATGQAHGGRVFWRNGLGGRTLAQRHGACHAGQRHHAF
jgi:hypothetical protein